eukprot:m.258836 g.258836  ORF g.258836 m.258836 type:complete len:544 (+) comp37167_c0_seq1:125-1756(+)
MFSRCLVRLHHPRTKTLFLRTFSTKMEYDLVVIGGGSGGSAAARRSAEYGAKVILIEQGATRDANGVRTGAGVGGTCVNVGCVPKKLMFMAAQQRESMVGPLALAKGFGFDVPESAGKFDWAATKTKRDAYVKMLNANYGKNWAKAGIETLTGVASFVDAGTVKVTSEDGSTQLVKGKKVLIACGGKPSTLPIPGGEHAITSDGFFDLEEQPKKVAVIGAGYIAVEMAGILHGLGSETHLFFRGDTVMRRGFDPYIVSSLMHSLEEHGPVLHKLSTPSKIEKLADGTMTLSTDSGDYAGFDCILVATGRTPVTDVLNLSNAGVKTDARGYISVDAHENTNVENVFAIGDATTSGYELTPVAIAAGRRLGDRVFKGEERARIDYATIATVVFSHPPIGMIGLTEPQAIEEFGADNVQVKEAKFKSMIFAFSEPEGKVETCLKVVLAGPTELVVGLHCIGPLSDEMMQGFAVAVRMGATRADFEASVAIHPTIGEEFVTFGGWGQKKDAEGAKTVLLPPYITKTESTKEEIEAQIKQLQAKLASM